MKPLGWARLLSSVVRLCLLIEIRQPGTSRKKSSEVIASYVESGRLATSIGYEIFLLHADFGARRHQQRRKKSKKKRGTTPFGYDVFGRPKQPVMHLGDNDDDFEATIRAERERAERVNEQPREQNSHQRELGKRIEENTGSEEAGERNDCAFLSALSPAKAATVTEALLRLQENEARQQMRQEKCKLK
ncbi:hypothetical protein BDQ12DRAFT_670687 [Crucibulum laeve]|uniref:Uncharacterized protein n=1 Tax=Crucibulum laeve TaxID=68775 RepID=A0A5C3LK07_9AGAR|nr:hypothetical protein BDQ12DRAFT_670687 [Crucibulum laeve]